MVTVPAFAWRGGAVVGGLTVGVGVGVVLGALAWLDSGMLIVGVIVCVVLTVGYGTWMGRWMARHWPGARALSGADRVAVAQIVRSGAPVTDTGRARAILDYATGLRAAAEKARLRWLVWVLLAVATGTALWDTAFGSVANAIVSAIYLAMVGLEVFWWPRRQGEILRNAEHAAAAAAKMVAEQPGSGKR